MKLALMTAATLAVMGVATTAQAGEAGQAYINVGAASVEDAGIAVGARLGYDFTENFAAEVEGGFGISSSDLGLGIDSKVKSQFGGFVKGSLPVAEQFDIFARVGYHTTDVKQTVGTTSASASVDGIAFGGGIEFGLAEGWGLRAEYTNYDGDGGSADSFGASVVYRFGN